MEDTNLVFGIYPETQEMDVPSDAKCYNCQRVFTDYYLLVNHMKYCDGVRNELPCRFCDVMCRTEETRKWHEKVINRFHH